MPKKHLHIAILSTFFDPFMSGAETCVEQIVNRLGRKDAHAFTVITAKLAFYLPRYEHRGRYIIIRLGIGHKIDKWLYPLLAPFTVMRIHADIAHAVMESYAGIALWLLGFFGASPRRLLTLQSGDLDEKAKFGKIPHWLWKKIHTSPDRVIAISNFLSSRAITLGATHVQVIPNGVPLGKLKYLAEQITEKTKKIVIVCVARLSYEKGVMDLVRAFALVHKEFPEAQLKLIGDGNERHEIEQEIERLQLQEFVVLCGKLPHLQAMSELARATCAVLPSHGEGLGIAALEALALRVPIVASNVGGIPDVVSHEHTGLLFETKNINNLASSITRMLKDVELRDRCIDNGKQFVEQFDWNTIAKAYRDIYTKINVPRILFATGIYPPHPGGPATYVASLASECRDRMYDVAILTYGDRAVSVPPQGILLYCVSRHGNVIQRYVRYFMALWDIASQYDLIYAQDSFCVGLPAYIVSKLLNKPLLIKVVGDPAWESARDQHACKDSLEVFQTKRYNFKIELIRIISRLVIRGAYAVITPSNYLRGIIAGWGIPLTKIRLIYNAVHFSDSMSEIDGWPTGKIILYVGRLVEWKGLLTLVHTIRELQKDITDVSLVIIGDGPELQELQKLVKELDVSSQVHFFGARPQTQVAWAMKHANVFVLFSEYEGLSHVLIEAQYSGLPTVASAIPGNSEVIEHKKNGLLVPLHDYALLQKSIRMLLTETDIAEMFARAGEERSDRFSRSRMMDETFELFEYIGR